MTHTHQLLAGFARAYPNSRLVVTQTGARDNFSDLLRTPEGLTVLAQGIQTGFPDLLQVGGMKCPHRVRHYYESTIDDPDNPVYRSLAGQYASAIRSAGTPHLIAQNINPLVSILKADESGLLNDLAPIQVIGVMHDTVDMRRRLDYVPLDVQHQPVHALLLRRLMYLDSKYLGRTRTELRHNSVYAGYLDSAGFEELFATSAAVGEHIR